MRHPHIRLDHSMVFLAASQLVVLHEHWGACSYLRLHTGYELSRKFACNFRPAHSKFYPAQKMVSRCICSARHGFGYLGIGLCNVPGFSVPKQGRLPGHFLVGVVCGFGFRSHIVSCLFGGKDALDKKSSGGRSRARYNSPVYLSSS